MIQKLHGPKNNMTIFSISRCPSRDSQCRPRLEMPFANAVTAQSFAAAVAAPLGLGGLSHIEVVPIELGLVVTPNKINVAKIPLKQ